MQTVKLSLAPVLLPACRASAPAPAASSAAAASAAGQVFIVFFDFDKSNLTAEAQAVVPKL